MVFKNRKSNNNTISHLYGNENTFLKKREEMGSLFGRFQNRKGLLSR